jgi:hypothetical protein
MSDEWSFEDFQCGLGVSEDCEGLVIDWSKGTSFQNLINEIVPAAETLFVFGIQYMSSQLSSN